MAKRSIAEQIRETALEILETELIMAPIFDLQKRVEEQLGLRLRREYFLNNFAGDPRFSIHNDRRFGLSLYPTALPKKIRVLAAQRELERAAS